MASITTRVAAMLVLRALCVTGRSISVAVSRVMLVFSVQNLPVE